MGGRGPADERDALRAAVRAILIGLVLLTPLAFGSVQHGAVLAIEIGGGLIGLLALLALVRDPAALPARARPVLLVAGVPVAVGAVQLVPLPGALVRLLAGPTAEAREALSTIGAVPAAATAPLSLSPPDTLDALLRLTAYVLVGLATAIAIRRPEHLRRLLAAVALSAAFQALYGSAEYLSGHQHIFAYAKKYDLDAATGTFINSNHFAGYLAIALPLVLGLLVAAWPARGAPGGWRARAVFLGSRDGFWLGPALLATVVIWVGILLSYSRGGLGAALVGIGAFGVARGRGRRRLAAGLLAIVLLLPVGYLGLLEIRAPAESFAAPAPELMSLGFRVPLWRASLALVPPYAVLGSGLGTFEAGFRAHRPETVDLRVDHLHNDWLQTLIEGGLVSLAAVVVLALLVLLPRRFAPAGRRAGILSAALRAALLAIAFHSLLDFSLRIPAVALLVAVLAGATVCRGLEDRPAPE